MMIYETDILEALIGSTGESRVAAFANQPTELPNPRVVWFNTLRVRISMRWKNTYIVSGLSLKRDCCRYKRLVTIWSLFAQQSMFHRSGLLLLIWICKRYLAGNRPDQQEPNPTRRIFSLIPFCQDWGYDIHLVQVPARFRRLIAGTRVLASIYGYFRRVPEYRRHSLVSV